MTSPHRPLRVPLLCLALVAAATSASAQPPAPAPAAPAARAAPARQSAGQGIAVLGLGASRDEAHALARAVYASSLRPRSLDEARARVLAGDPPPSLASREARELAELRAAITGGEDAASRRLLASIAAQLGVQAILVVEVHDEAPAPAATAQVDPDAGGQDAGAEVEAGAPARAVSARLFLAETGELDAARYAPEAGGAPASWRSTVTSLERRFSTAFPPSPGARAPASANATKPVAPPTMRSDEAGTSKPFYASAWFWGALGGAALIGAGFYFASRDTSDQPIHLQMRVPR